MKISPIMAPAAATPQSPNVRSLKMATVATPLNELSTGEPQELSTGTEELQADEKMSISTNNEPNAPDEATQPISPQLAALAKQRRALQREREAFNREREEFTKTKGIASIDPDRLRKEPINVLLEAGVTYDQLAEHVMNQQSNSDVHALRSELKSLKDGIQTEFEKREQQQRTQALSEMKKEANSLLVGDDFELVRETGRLDDVMTLIERTYDTEGELLTVREAMKLVEDELLERQRKLLSLKKIQASIKPAEVPEQQQKGMKTLTNKDTASIPMSRRARAYAAFNGTLKK